ncbi:hypothetical protein NGRA_3185 [Nosema granulosis]|uniref:Uncharacterized protein n=1 Tax=Nosema granulosis TaxID=83296 RepID=A0A9P6GWP4_9MICR|nr:hypothetical protein NGRA_3185 [Nosema granulosis]
MIFIYLFRFVFSTILESSLELEQDSPLDLSLKHRQEINSKQEFQKIDKNNIQTNDDCENLKYLEESKDIRSFRKSDHIKSTKKRKLIEHHFNQCNSTLKSMLAINQNIYEDKVDQLLNNFTNECKILQTIFNMKNLKEYIRTESYKINSSEKSGHVQLNNLVRASDNIIRNICKFLGASFYQNSILRNDTEYINDVISIYEGFYNLDILRCMKKYLIYSSDLKGLDEMLNKIADKLFEQAEILFDGRNSFFLYNLKIDNKDLGDPTLEKLIILLLIEVKNNKKDIHNLSSLLFIVFLDSSFFHQKKIKVITDTKKISLLLKAIILLKISTKKSKSISVSSINRILVDLITRYLSIWHPNKQLHVINNIAMQFVFNELDVAFNNTYTNDNIAFLYNFLDNRNSVLRKYISKNRKLTNIKNFSNDEKLSLCLFRNCCKLLNSIKYVLLSNLEIQEIN